MKPGIVYTAVGALIGLLSGCAAPHTPSSAQSVAAYDDIEAQPASALLFETRLPYGGRPVDLARGPRDPSAFVGFDGPVTTYLYEEIDDHQADNGNSRYDRRTLTYRLGSSTR